MVIMDQFYGTGVWVPVLGIMCLIGLALVVLSASGDKRAVDEGDKLGRAGQIGNVFGLLLIIVAVVTVLYYG